MDRVETSNTARLEEGGEREITSKDMLRAAGAHSSTKRLSRASESTLGGIRMSKPASASDGCRFITKPLERENKESDEFHNKRHQLSRKWEERQVSYSRGGSASLEEGHVNGDDIAFSSATSFEQIELGSSESTNTLNAFEEILNSRVVIELGTVARGSFSLNHKPPGTPLSIEYSVTLTRRWQT